MPFGEPEGSSIEHPRNLIRLAVCELRFPIILDLEKGFPQRVQSAIGKHFPRSQPLVDVSQAAPGPAYIFRSKDKHWSVALRPFSISLETDEYRRFSAFSDQLKWVLGRVTPGVLPVDFFSRIGLRYINAVPTKIEGLNGWINGRLQEPLLNDAFGEISMCQHEVRGVAPSGGYRLWHGIAQSQTTGQPEYVIDTDFAQEDVEPGKVLKQLERLNRDSFALFNFVIGDKARRFMRADHQ